MSWLPTTGEASWLTPCVTTGPIAVSIALLSAERSNNVSMRNDLFLVVVVLADMVCPHTFAIVCTHTCKVLDHLGPKEEEAQTNVRLTKSLM